MQRSSEQCDQMMCSERGTPNKLKTYQRTLRFLGTVLFGLWLAAPASAQLPFPIGGRGGSFGIGDIISVIGSRGSRGTAIGDQRLDKAQAAIQLASILFELNRQRESTGPRTPEPYPGGFPELPGGDPSYYPAPGDSGSSARPQGYEYITNGGRPARLDPSILPLTINPGNEPHSGMTRYAVDTWNSAGLGQLFELTTGQADLTIDWSGARVSSGARAETRMIKSAQGIVPTDLSVKTSGRSADQLTRVLTHELGHVLGLDHSRSREDVMYMSEQNSRAPVLSDRDRQMLHWLYSQDNYSPIVGATDVNSVAHRLSEPVFFHGGHSHDLGETVCRGH